MHYLQIALERKGFISDIDDQQWWQFGPSTFDCLLSFQAILSTCTFCLVNIQMKVFTADCDKIPLGNRPLLKRGQLQISINRLICIALA